MIGIRSDEGNLTQQENEINPGNNEDGIIRAMSRRTKYRELILGLKINRAQVWDD